MSKATEYTTIYRTGGTANCKWNRCTSGTYEESKKLQDGCERMGYKALIHKTAALNSIGMPEGWDYKQTA